MVTEFGSDPTKLYAQFRVRMPRLEAFIGKVKQLSLVSAIPN